MSHTIITKVIFYFRAPPSPDFIDLRAMKITKKKRFIITVRLKCNKTNLARLNCVVF